MNKATVISLVPFQINEFKPGIYPGVFEIPASKEGVPTIFHVGESAFFVEVDETRSIQVKVNPADMAKSLVYDYVISCLAYNESKESMPGIFWKDGEYDLGQVLKKFPDDLAYAKRVQHNWFMELIKMADDDWEKTGRHQTISDLQRYAVRALNMTRDYLLKPQEVGIDVIKCFACQNNIPKEAIICPNCKLIIDEVKWKTLKFATV